MINKTNNHKNKMNLVYKEYQKKALKKQNKIIKFKMINLNLQMPNKSLIQHNKYQWRKF